MIMWRVPRPAPTCHSAIAAALASLSIPHGTPKRSPMRCRSGTSANGMFTDETATPRAWSTVDGTPRPIASTPSSNSSSTACSSAATTSSSEVVGVGNSVREPIPPSRSTIPAAIFVPPRSTPMTRFALTGPWLR